MSLHDVLDTDLAYAAGMIDGDGSICVARSPRPQKNGSYSFMVTLFVSQKEDDTPLWFQSIFGGRVRRVGKGKWTVTAHGTPTFFPPMWRWEIYCTDAANVLECVLPHLKTKKYRAELAIELARLHGRRGGKKAEVSLEESERREHVALALRAENQKSNTKFKKILTWGAIN